MSAFTFSMPTIASSSRWISANGEPGSSPFATSLDGCSAGVAAGSAGLSTMLICREGLGAPVPPAAAARPFIKNIPSFR